MKKILWSTPLVLLAAAADAATIRCGWEDGTSTVLGSFGNVARAENVSAPDPVHRGKHSLRVTESPEGGTPQVYLAFIESLSDGDTVHACFWAYDTTPGVPPSVRIWGHYTNSGDLLGYQGTASGNTSYTSGSGWTQLCHEWVFDSGGGRRDALVVEARLFSPISNEPDFWIDDLEVTVSSFHAVVTLACGSDLSLDDEGKEESTWGNVKSLYR